MRPPQRQTTLVIDVVAWKGGDRRGTAVAAGCDGNDEGHSPHVCV